MRNSFPHIFAHTLSSSPEAEWQTLAQHASKTAERVAVFAESLGSPAWTAAAALLHDMGKVDPLFQDYLRRCAYNADHDDDIDDNAGKTERAGVNHSGAGAAFAMERFGKDIGKILAYLIWRVTRIDVLAPLRWASVRRNEVERIARVCRHKILSH